MNSLVSTFHFFPLLLRIHTLVRRVQTGIAFLKKERAFGCDHFCHTTKQHSNRLTHGVIKQVGNTACRYIQFFREIGKRSSVAMRAPNFLHQTCTRPFSPPATRGVASTFHKRCPRGIRASYVLLLQTAILSGRLQEVCKVILELSILSHPYLILLNRAEICMQPGFSTYSVSKGKLMLRQKNSDMFLLILVVRTALSKTRLNINSH